jgi:uncharacterized protein YndB with AHSA1/START domain
MDDILLEAAASIQILKPASEVYDAIINPDKLTRYFISVSNGRMEEGKQLTWKFPEFSSVVPVKVGRLEKDSYISFNWDADNPDLNVEMTLKSGKNGSTVISISEKSRKRDEEGLKWMRGNTEGWANFLACLKAYLEYGINLRKGAFEFMAD